MHQEEFTRLFHETVTTMEKLLIVKGGEYADSSDRLANFKRGASLTGVTSLQCAFVYASKHYDSIATFVRDSALRQDRPRSESIEGRLDDLMNYCLLMKAIIVETRSVANKHPSEIEKQTEWAKSQALGARNSGFYGNRVLGGDGNYPSGAAPVWVPGQSEP